MDCVLIRHGIAVEPEEWDGSEENRPLTEKGRKRVLRTAAGLAALDCKPTHVLSSPLLRAHDTARLLRTVVCPSRKVMTCDELAVGSTPERIVALLRSFPAESILLCIGHEPLLGEAAALLLCGKPMTSFPMKKAGAARIHFPGPVKPGQGLLQWWLEPMQLRVLGRGKKSVVEIDEHG
ncbi:MAG: phosphohistidine phosphatase SixA [Nitrospira sp.]|nr:phosphohistidine phosphatase SixA [Nitrospira sp.]MBH0181860.1 phosphohistidine phosphatase SixA [Nitrospira sp.]